MKFGGVGMVHGHEFNNNDFMKLLLKRDPHPPNREE
jgi:hypothetical protein